MRVDHVSMHGAVLNSLALKKYGISAATKTPPGGVIVRKPGTNEPYGLIMETAFLPVFEQPEPMTPEQEIEWTKAGQMLYAEAGVTTAHEGATHLAQLETMKRATEAGANIIDVVAYPFITDLDKVLARVPGGRLGQVRQALQDRRRQDHHRRLAPGPDGLLHDALPDGRPRRREELERRADRPRRTSSTQWSSRSTTSASRSTSTPTATRAIDAFLKAHEFAGRGRPHEGPAT